MEQKPSTASPAPKPAAPKPAPAAGGAPGARPMPAKKPGAELPANFRHLVRIANTDLKGDKSVFIALRGIRGVSAMYSHMVCHLSGISPHSKAGVLTEQQVTLIDDIIRHPLKHHAPSWMLNRRKNYETGEDGHIITNDLIFTKDNDLKRLKKIKSYRGMRHMAGLPVRGQRVKSKHRRNKAAGKGKLGVIRKASQPSSAGKSDKK